MKPYLFQQSEVMRHICLEDWFDNDGANFIEFFCRQSTEYVHGKISRWTEDFAEEPRSTHVLKDRHVIVLQRQFRSRIDLEIVV